MNELWNKYGSTRETLGTTRGYYGPLWATRESPRTTMDHYTREPLGATRDHYGWMHGCMGVWIYIVPKFRIGYWDPKL